MVPRPAGPGAGASVSRPCLVTPRVSAKTCGRHPLGKNSTCGGGKGRPRRGRRDCGKAFPHHRVLRGRFRLYRPPWGSWAPARSTAPLTASLPRPTCGYSCCAAARSATGYRRRGALAVRLVVPAFRPRPDTGQPAPRSRARVGKVAGSRRTRLGRLPQSRRRPLRDPCRRGCASKTAAGSAAVEPQKPHRLLTWHAHQGRP